MFNQKKNEKWKTLKKEEEGNNVYFQSAHLSPGTEYSQQFSAIKKIENVFFKRWKINPEKLRKVTRTTRFKKE